MFTPVALQEEPAGVEAPALSTGRQLAGRMTEQVDPRQQVLVGWGQMLGEQEPPARKVPVEQPVASVRVHAPLVSQQEPMPPALT